MHFTLPARSNPYFNSGVIGNNIPAIIGGGKREDEFCLEKFHQSSQKTNKN